MAEIKVKSKSNDKPKYISYTNKSDYMAIKLLKDSSIHVEHEILAKSLIKRKLAEEVKDVDFEVEKGTIKYIEDVNK